MARELRRDHESAASSCGRLHRRTFLKSSGAVLSVLGPVALSSEEARAAPAKPYGKVGYGARGYGEASD
jgi:hypothetical protein